MKIVTINKENIDIEHICCAIGNDKENQAKALAKKEWLKKRFNDGLIFKRFDGRGKFFIEYIPIEKVWKPVIGKNYMFINCLWVSGQFKGKGLSRLLLDECLNDAKKAKMDGVAVISSNKVKPFLTDKKFYLNHSFEIVDSAPPYFELLVYKLNKSAKNPAFTKNVKNSLGPGEEGFTLIYSNQCPFMEYYSNIYYEILKTKGIKCKVIKLASYTEAQKSFSPFGTFGIFYNGKYISHELFTGKNFEKLIGEVTQN